VKVAAYQAPLSALSTVDVLRLIRTQVERCEAEGVTFLCCPEAILGGLADYLDEPTRLAIAVSRDRLETVLAPLASDRVTTIIGFTELGAGDRLYNSAAVFHRGSVTGVYRKLHPAINHSVYEPGSDVPIFHIAGLTFGIVVCYDSTFAEPARCMAAQGATALFVPTNNAMPLARASGNLVTDARKSDVDRATENHLWVVRADVAGRTYQLLSYGSSAIVDPHGTIVSAARPLTNDLLVAEISPCRYSACGSPALPTPQTPVSR
jgi:5-aminopentanamidase